MSDKKKYIPKPLPLDSSDAEHQLIFNHWVQKYNGLDDPIGLEGLDRLHEFIGDQHPYIADGRRSFIRVLGERETTHDIPGYWVELTFISHDGRDEWGRLKYLHDGSWVCKVFHKGEKWAGRLQTATVPEDVVFDPLLHVEVSREEMARVPIGVVLYAFTTAFTVRAHQKAWQTPPETIDQDWYYQSQLLRMAHVLENALVELYNKSKLASQPA